MDKFIKYGLTFLAGSAVGALVMKKIFDSQYEVIEDEEVNEKIEEQGEETVTTPEVRMDAVRECTITTTVDEDVYPMQAEEYQDILEDLGYSITPNEPTQQNVPTEERDTSKPYFITDQEQDESEWEFDEYTYYNDGYVTDSTGMPVDNADVINTIGLDFERHFDRTGSDQIWMRNERLEMDYSILKDPDNFSEVAPTRLKRMVGLQ